MDFAYSPHREGGAMHLPSPTHQGYRLENPHFASLQQLRRSLSRSPSKPSRFQLHTKKADAPGSPLSPLALARAFTPKPPHKPVSPIAAAHESPFASQTVPAKKKFTLRRSGPFRSSPRNRANNPKSPRRALVDSTDLGNSTTPFASRSLFDDENTTTPAPVRKPSVDFWDTAESMRFDIDDKPIKFGISRSQNQSSSNAPGASCFTPNQASPLKRRDGNPAFDSTSAMTPNPKRRSLHGAPGAEFSIFETPIRPAPFADDSPRVQDNDDSFNLFATPANATQTPMKQRPMSIRRSTSQRSSANSPRPNKTLFDGDFAMPGLAASKSKQRMSLDGGVFRSSNGSQARHPLANSLTVSSSSPAVGGDSPAHMPPPPTVAPTSRHPFAKSLPIGASRPTETGTDQLFATPAALKNVRLHAAPVPLSTGGLMSKKHRDISLEIDEYKPPGTPIKRQSYPPALAETPTSNRRSQTFKPLQQPVFGSTSTPFNSIQSSNHGSNFFSDMANPHVRRRSFVDIDGDSDCNESPTGNKHMMDSSQSSADDGPPTPTKPSGDGRRSKESSLRRKTFGRSRPSLNNAFPAEEDHIVIPKASEDFVPSKGSPHTPNETFAPFDSANLSLSSSRRDSMRDSLSFNSSLASASFPPATPTGPRGSFGFFNQSQIITVTENDVDESLAARFRSVEKLDGAEGEFSQVFKVSRPIQDVIADTSSPPGSRCWVVKKSKKPLMGSKDSAQKHREVNALRALRGHEHIVTFEDSWVDQSHLYIQTEYCEDGNLRQFLQKYARAGCLDNFRTWKMLLELSSGLQYIHESGFIHLDLKPANILLDFSGNLKIADFGMAAQWPLPEHFDGEGDRHYLALEAMNGNPDKPSDVFALGLMMVEICSNCFMPEMGDDWYRLRSGNFIDVPSLTWSEDSTLLRNSDGLPISNDHDEGISPGLMVDTDFDFTSVGLGIGVDEAKEFAKAPDFMKDALSPYSMDQTVRRMLDPNPASRPTANEVHRSFGCQWVDQRRRAGATIYEGNFGPEYDVLSSYADHPDAMDTS